MNSKLNVLNAQLLVHKEDLRTLEGSLKDLHHAVAHPGTEISPEDFTALIPAILQRIQHTKNLISRLEAERLILLKS